MSKQTAVEWFFNQLIDKKNQTPEILWAAYLNAKAMEEEQSFEQYYNETYGGDK